MDFVEDSSEEGESSEYSTPPKTPELIDLVSTSSDSQVDELSTLYGELSPYDSDDEPGKCQACAMLSEPMVTKAKSFP